MADPTNSDREFSTQTLSLDALRHAFQSCIQEHGSHCARLRHVLLAGGNSDPSIYQQPSLLHVLDINTGQVQLAPTSCQYIALSYVWSSSGHHLPSLYGNQVPCVVSQQEPRALNREWPQTIIDAISVCRAVGINYLWVDFLCINKNDTGNVQRQINQMDQVYSFATATIVVASNTNEEESTTCSQRLIPELTEKPNLEQILSETKCATRAWTHQEFLLSRRLIIFTSHGVFYHCMRPSEVELKSWSLPSLDKVSCWDVYNIILKSYTRRRLSYKSDTLHAITGMLRVLARYSDDSYIAGIPTKQLWYGLLWQPGRYSVRQHPWPSWSWAGWTSPDDQMCEVYYPCKHIVQSNHAYDRRRGKRLYPAIHNFVYHDYQTGQELAIHSSVSPEGESDRNLAYCDSRCTFPCKKLSHLTPDREFFSQGGCLHMKAKTLYLSIKPFEPDTQSELTICCASRDPPFRRYNIMNGSLWVGTTFLSPIETGESIDGLPQYTYPNLTHDCKFVVMTNFSLYISEICPWICGKSSKAGEKEFASEDSSRIFDKLFYKRAEKEGEMEFRRWQYPSRSEFHHRTRLSTFYQENPQADPHRGMPFPPEIYLSHVMLVESGNAAGKDESGCIPLLSRRAVGVIIQQSGAVDEDIYLG